MKFTKMHGAGNDYIYVNCFEEKIKNPSEVSIKVSDRHFGIGSDGLIMVCPSDVADFRMEMYNADGSQGKMCGNGSRCVAKYVYDNHMTDKDEITLETLGGIKTIKIKAENGKAVAATVNMGEPILAPDEIPVALSGKNVINRQVLIEGTAYNITCVSMGNPHCVVFWDDTDSLEIEKIGKTFENNPLFPERVNTEFLQFVDEKTYKMRVWERGSGETLACGTGTCASVVAAVLCGKSKKDEDITVHLLGGDLVIRWDSATNCVFMTGPAATVCTGEIDI